MGIAQIVISFFLIPFGHAMETTGRLSLAGQSLLGSDAQVVASVSVANESWSFAPVLAKIGPAWRLERSEISATQGWGDLEAQLGFFKVSWGSLEGLSLLDQLSAQDLRDPLRPERLSSPTLRLRVLGEAFEIEGVAITQASLPQMPEMNQQEFLPQSGKWRSSDNTLELRTHPNGQKYRWTHDEQSKSYQQRNWWALRGSYSSDDWEAQGAFGESGGGTPQVELPSLVDLNLVGFDGATALVELPEDLALVVKTRKRQFQVLSVQVPFVTSSLRLQGARIKKADGDPVFESLLSLEIPHQLGEQSVLLVQRLDTTEDAQATEQIQWAPFMKQAWVVGHLTRTVDFQIILKSYWQMLTKTNALQIDVDYFFSESLQLQAAFTSWQVPNTSWLGQAKGRSSVYVGVVASY